MSVFFLQGVHHLLQSVFQLFCNDLEDRRALRMDMTLNCLYTHNGIPLASFLFPLKFL